MTQIEIKKQNPYNVVFDAQKLLQQNSDVAVKRAIQILTRQFGPENAATIALKISSGEITVKEEDLIDNLI